MVQSLEAKTKQPFDFKSLQAGRDNPAFLELEEDYKAVCQDLSKNEEEELMKHKTVQQAL